MRSHSSFLILDLAKSPSVNILVFLYQPCYLLTVLCSIKQSCKTKHCHMSINEASRDSCAAPNCKENANNFYVISSSLVMFAHVKFLNKEEFTKVDFLKYLSSSHSVLTTHEAAATVITTSSSTASTCELTI